MLSKAFKLILDENNPLKIFENPSKHLGMSVIFKYLGRGAITTKCTDT